MDIPFDKRKAKLTFVSHFLMVLSHDPVQRVPPSDDSAKLVTGPACPLKSFTAFRVYTINDRISIMTFTL